MTTDGACTAFQRRPFLKNFLEDVCQVFEVAVFTAGSKVRIYASPQSYQFILFCTERCRVMSANAVLSNAISQLLLSEGGRIMHCWC